MSINMKIEDPKTVALRKELEYYTNLIENHKRQESWKKTGAKVPLATSCENLPSKHTVSNAYTINRTQPQSMFKFNKSSSVNNKQLASTDIPKNSLPTVSKNSFCNSFNSLKLRNNTTVLPSAVCLKAPSVGQTKKIILEIHTTETNQNSVKHISEPKCIKNLSQQNLMKEILNVTERLRNKTKEGKLMPKKNSFDTLCSRQNMSGKLTNVSATSNNYPLENCSVKNLSKIASASDSNVVPVFKSVKVPCSVESLSFKSIIPDNVKVEHTSKQTETEEKQSILPPRVLGNSCIKSTNLPNADKLSSSKYKLVNKKNPNSAEKKSIRKLTPAKKIPESLTSDSVKCSSSTDVNKLIASKYKLVNKKNPNSAEKSTYPTKRVLQKTPSNSINNSRKTNVHNFITSKYKLVNKKNPNSAEKSKYPIQKVPQKIASNSINNSKRTNVHKLITSKYKLVNKNVTLSSEKKKFPKLTSAKKVSQRIISKYKLINRKQTPVGYRNNAPSDPRSKLVFHSPAIASKTLHDTPSNMKINNAVKNSNQILSSKGSHKKFTVKSKYKIVKKCGSSQKKKLRRNVRRNSSSALKKFKAICSMHSDIDLIMELTDMKNSSVFQSPILLSPKANSTLVHRVFKSKNTLVNRNEFSADTKIARTIKSKYLTWNKKSSLQRLSPRNLRLKTYHGYQANSFKKQSWNNKQKIKAMGNTRYKINNTRRSSRTRNFPAKLPSNRSFKLDNTLGKRIHRRSFSSSTLHNSSLQKTPASLSAANRMLHRSIHCALSSSTKKKLSKTNIYCTFYNRFGRCNKGAKCLFRHDPSKIAVCTRFLRGTCKREGCPFSHEVCPGKMALCSFFLVGKCSAEKCPYRHENLSPGAQMCRPFAQGYCPRGKECDRAHVLVCPQYLQGSCQNGSSCPFPHPVRKEKVKNLPNVSDKDSNMVQNTEEGKDRYFQPSAKVLTPVSSEKVIPQRRRKLPEQPSFISLSTGETRLS